MVPTMLNKPINDNTAVAHQSGNPLSIISVGIWVATNAICQPQTKKPKVK